MTRVDFSLRPAESAIDVRQQGEGDVGTPPRRIRAARHPGDRAPSERRDSVMSGTTSKVSKATALARVLADIAGTKNQFPYGGLNVGHDALTVASVVWRFPSPAHAATAPNTARDSVQGAV